MRFWIVMLLLMTLAIVACDHPPVQKDTPTDQTSANHTKTEPTQMTSSPGAAQAPYELQFIDAMIAHHQETIDAAHLVATRAEHQELKLLAKSMISAQQQEIADMRSWRKAWFGDAEPAINIDLPGVREGMESVDLDKLDGLKENVFDLEFLRQMIPHHRAALAMANDLLRKDVHAELKQLAQRIVQEHEDEIEQMQGWQTQWSK
ncbi:MAG TPA: DUF305 domain-containing protein [Pyrinomonadaceae bacterium]|jgi:uncharacterized protein (DUF305 family)|nr:DUF305 domain-containing protein [Pyrinomonadaceae bacterium]